MRTFQRRHWVRLKNFLTPELLFMLQGRVLAEKFQPWKSPYSKRLIITSSRTGAMPGVFLAGDYLFDLIRDMTGFPKPIKSLIGKIYKLLPNDRQFVDWHTDPPLCAMPIAPATLILNLGRRYSGGRTELRAPDSERVFARLSTGSPGDAAIFRNNLVHRSEPVIGPEPKITFIGLFSSDPPGTPSKSSPLSDKKPRGQRRRKAPGIRL